MTLPGIPEDKPKLGSSSKGKKELKKIPEEMDELGEKAYYMELGRLQAQTEWEKENPRKIKVDMGNLFGILLFIWIVISFIVLMVLIFDITVVIAAIHSLAGL